MKRLLLCFTCVLMVGSSFAQNTRLVKGVVFDHEEIPMAGAIISVAGVSGTVQSDTNGNFEIFVSPYAKRVSVQADGYLAQSAEIDGSYIVFNLKIDTAYAKRKAQEAEASRIAAEQEAIAKAKAEESAHISAEKKAAAMSMAEHRKVNKEPVSNEGVVESKRPTAELNTYKIGDFYDDGIRQGVVFEVSDNGKHGKIISTTQEFLQWADGSVYKQNLNATSSDNGASNMQNVMQEGYWQDLYPAFSWCAELGVGWYLPAIDELKTIRKVKSQVNATLSSNGGYPLDSNYYYWSSTEYDIGKGYAFIISLSAGGTDFDLKDGNYYVRAVYAF